MTYQRSEQLAVLAHSIANPVSWTEMFMMALFSFILLPQIAKYPYCRSLHTVNLPFQSRGLAIRIPDFLCLKLVVT